jgi:crotonobetainyl-CoA:carnitine CoA-transferase CaiB-like acyl-CoA transferase
MPGDAPQLNHAPASASQLPTPYSDLCVVELADDPAGEALGKLLATAGADVIKVELPEGAASRHIGPSAVGSREGDPDASLNFWFYNVSKRSVVIDYQAADGMARLRDLLRRADIVITGWRPSEWAALGITPEDLRRDAPRLILANLSPFGLDGPWADLVSSDLVGLALGGPLNSCGYDDHSIPPIRPGGDQGYQLTASFGHLGVLLALLERDQTGHGQLVDVAMHDCLSVSAELANPYWFYPRVLVHRQTCRHAQPTATQPALFATADDRYVYFALITAEQKPWQSLVAWMESKRLAADLTDPAYDDPEYRLANFAHIQQIVEVFFLLQSASDSYHEGQQRGLPIGVLNAPEDLPLDEHLAARGFFVPVDDDAPGAPHLYPGAPIRFSALAAAPITRAPRLGEHTAEVIGGTA